MSNIGREGTFKDKDEMSVGSFEEDTEVDLFQARFWEVDFP